MLITEKQKCVFCGSIFDGITQFSTYYCRACGKKFIICPSCKNRICNECGGTIVSNNDYIDEHGITDIYEHHINPKGPIMY